MIAYLLAYGILANGLALYLITSQSEALYMGLAPGLVLFLYHWLESLYFGLRAALLMRAQLTNDLHS